MLKRRCEACQAWLRSGFDLGRRATTGERAEVKVLRKAGGLGVNEEVGVEGEVGDWMKRGIIKEERRVTMEKAVKEREPMRPIWEKGSLLGEGGCEWR